MMFYNQFWKYTHITNVNTPKVSKLTTKYKIPFLFKQVFTSQR